MSLRKGIRFDVFHRDGFACVYCGRRPPDVLLEADHIVPRAKGGVDEIDNLATSCRDCNNGKSAKSLAVAPARKNLGLAAKDIAERTAQAEAYASSVLAERAAEERLMGMVIGHWTKTFGGSVRRKKSAHVHTLPAGEPAYPEHASVLKFLRRLSVSEVLTAVDVASGSRIHNTEKTRYFYGICWKMIRDREDAS